MFEKVTGTTQPNSKEMRDDKRGRSFIFLFYCVMFPSHVQGLFGTVAHFATTTLEAALAFLFPLTQ